MLSRQKTLTKWAKWNESDPEFFKGRQHHFSLQARLHQAVLALKCGNDQLNIVCATDHLRSCFRKPEVLNRTWLDELLHRSRHIFDRNVQVDTMLVEEIDRIQTLSRLGDASATFWMCSGRLFKLFQILPPSAGFASQPNFVAITTLPRKGAKN